MADKTDEQIADEVHGTVKRLNTLLRDAALNGIRVSIETQTVSRVGSPAIDTVTAEVARVYPPRQRLPEPEELDNNG